MTKSQKLNSGKLLRRLFHYSFIVTLGMVHTWPVMNQGLRLVNAKKYVPFLTNREIFRVLGLMKTDMVNFTVQSLRPNLLQQAVQYERAKFQEILEEQPGK